MIDELPHYCPGTWPIDYLENMSQIVHGELACTLRRGHIGLCEAIDPDTGRPVQFPGLTDQAKR